MTTLPDRVESRIVRQGDACWGWSGTHNTNGYGSVWWDGAMRCTHVVVYEQLVAPVPPGMELDHTCENKGCCNPAHLEPVTHAENTRRGQRARREATHCSHGHELTPENTYIYPNGVWRACKTCRRVSYNRHYNRTRKAA